MPRLIDLIKGKWFMTKPISEMTTREKYEAFRLLEFYKSNDILNRYVHSRYEELRDFVMKTNKRSMTQAGSTDSLFPDIK